MLLAALIFQAQSFEVATIKPTPPDWRGGRYIRMATPRRFEAVSFAPRVLIAAAYGLNPAAVTGGPAWMDSERFHIVATTPGEKPSFEAQMDMLRDLLATRFDFAFHREEKTLPAFVLTAAHGGPKLNPSTAPPDQDPKLVNIVFPDRVELPARNATIAQFAAVMQRSIFDRPVVNRTGLTGRYDFDLAWVPNESQFDGLTKESPDAAPPSLPTALRQQLGLQLESAKVPVQVLVVDRISRPTAN